MLWYGTVHFSLKYDMDYIDIDNCYFNIHVKLYTLGLFGLGDLDDHVV